MKTKQPKARARFVSLDPAWERMKAEHNNIDHNDAVQESEDLRKLYERMWGQRVATSSVDVNQILRTLTEKKIPFVLTGTHGIAGWIGRPRATKDVDVLVRGGRNLTRAVKSLRALYPDLEVREFVGVVSFFGPGEKFSFIDVTYPHRADIAETLANPVWTEDRERGLRYRIPSLEAALANKYGAMLSLTRSLDKRMIDVVDFMRMVQHSSDEGRKAIDFTRLEWLGELVWPGGGGAEILSLVEMVKAGKAINLDQLHKLA